jgi:RimJ/RimL family protein N-acetyltransferase
MSDSRFLRTAGLELRAAAPGDLDALYRLWTHPGVRRYLFDDRQISREEARGFLERSERSFREEGYGLWVFLEKGSDDLAGFAGFLRSQAGEPSLIFGTRPDRWGRGYARAAASAVVGYAFEVLRRPRLVADVDEPNLASVRILEGLGMSPIRRAVVNGRPLRYYSLEPEGGRATRPAVPGALR